MSSTSLSRRSIDSSLSGVTHQWFCVPQLSRRCSRVAPPKVTSERTDYRMYYVPKNGQNESLDYDNSWGRFKSYVSSRESSFCKTDAYDGACSATFAQGRLRSGIAADSQRFKFLRLRSRRQLSAPKTPQVRLCSIRVHYPTACSPQNSRRSPVARH
jgi:hypothetical protein